MDLSAIIHPLNDVGDTSTDPAEVAALKSNESEVADWSFGRWWDSARTLWHPQMIHWHGCISSALMIQVMQGFSGSCCQVVSPI